MTNHNSKERKQGISMKNRGANHTNPRAADKSLSRKLSSAPWHPVLAALFALAWYVQAAETVHYGFEEGSGSVALDTGGLFDGTLVNDPAYVTNAVVGQFSLAFDGAAARVDVPAQVASGLKDRTYNMWVKTTNASGALFELNLWGGGFPADSLVLNTDGTARGHHFSGRDVIINGRIRINDGQWHHVALSLSSINGANLFVDGVQDAHDPTAVVPSQGNHLTGKGM